MSTLRYPAKIWQDEEGRYQVRFVGLPAAMTEGDTLDEAKEMAQDVITGVLEVMLSRERQVPRPLEETGPDIYLIAPAPEVAAPILLRWAREDAHLTLQQLATLVGVPYQSLQRLEKRVGNPSLKTLGRIAKALGRELQLSL